MNGHREPQTHTPRPDPQPWRLVIPVKAVGLGKSRLIASLREVGWSGDRELLGRSIAADTLDAAVEAVGLGQLVLVTSDPELGPGWDQRGCLVVPDPGRGLNPAIRAGLAASAGPRVAVLLGDLPALRAVELLAALREADQHDQSFVPDAEGVGTVLRCSTQGAAALRPLFGQQSAHRHTADGALRLDLALPGLRTDVDDVAGLVAARKAGLGPATAATLAEFAAVATTEATTEATAPRSGWM